MKLKSLLYSALCSVAFMGSGCTENQPEYTPAAPSETPEIYFSAADATSFNVGETDSEFTVTVYRSDDATAQTYPIQCVDQTDAALFNVPASVSFAAGESKTQFTVTYTATQLEGMKPYKMTFVVGDGVDTPYAFQRVTYTITYFPWENVTGPNGEEYGIWIDDILTTFFDLPEAALTWQVKIQKSPAINGLYRIVNPYGLAAFPGIRFTTGSFASGGPLDGEDHYMYLNCADPSHIFISDQFGEAIDGQNPVRFNTGANLSYGTISITGDYNFETADGNHDAAMSLAGTLTNGVVKFPERALLISMANYQNGSFYYANTNGTFRILFPGAVEEEDPEDVWENIGTGEYTDVLIYPLYGEPAQTWTVEVEQYRKDPNMYRMVNPYKTGVCPDGLNYDGDMYVELDATNPQCVIWDMQEIWYDSESPVCGSINAINLAANFVAGGNSIADIIANGYGDTFVNQVFTFGPAHLRMYFPNTDNENYQGKLLTADSNTEGKLVLSNAATQTAAANVRAVAAKRASKVQIYQLDAVKQAKNSRNYTGPKFKNFSVQ